MWDFQKQKIIKAKKDYSCNSYEWIVNSNFSDHEFEEEDLKLIDNFRMNGCKIKKGEIHILTTGKWEGEFCAVRQNIEMHNICEKYDLYPDE